MASPMVDRFSYFSDVIVIILHRNDQRPTSQVILDPINLIIEISHHGKVIGLLTIRIRVLNTDPYIIHSQLQLTLIPTTSKDTWH